MADESKVVTPVTQDITVVRRICQFEDGHTCYFTSTLVFKDGLLVHVVHGPQLPLYPITDGEPGPGILPGPAILG
jgi:hypothetical protein